MTERELVRKRNDSSLLSVCHNNRVVLDESSINTRTGRRNITGRKDYFLSIASFRRCSGSPNMTLIVTLLWIIALSSSPTSSIVAASSSSNSKSNNQLRTLQHRRTSSSSSLPYQKLQKRLVEQGIVDVNATRHLQRSGRIPNERIVLESTNTTNDTDDYTDVENAAGQADITSTTLTAGIDPNNEDTSSKPGDNVPAANSPSLDYCLSTINKHDKNYDGYLNYQESYDFIINDVVHHYYTNYYDELAASSSTTDCPHPNNLDDILVMMRVRFDILFLKLACICRTYNYQYLTTNIESSSSSTSNDCCNVIDIPANRLYRPLGSGSLSNYGTDYTKDVCNKLISDVQELRCTNKDNTKDTNDIPEDFPASPSTKPNSTGTTNSDNSSYVTTTSDQSNSDSKGNDNNNKVPPQTPATTITYNQQQYVQNHIIPITIGCTIGAVLVFGGIIFGVVTYQTRRKRRKRMLKTITIKTGDGGGGGDNTTAPSITSSLGSKLSGAFTSFRNEKTNAALVVNKEAVKKISGGNSIHSSNSDLSFYFNAVATGAASLSPSKQKRYQKLIDDAKATTPAATNEDPDKNNGTTTGSTSSATNTTASSTVSKTQYEYCPQGYGHLDLDDGEEDDEEEEEDENGITDEVVRSRMLLQMAAQNAAVAASPNRSSSSATNSTRINNIFLAADSTGIIELDPNDPTAQNELCFV